MVEDFLDAPGSPTTAELQERKPRDLARAVASGAVPFVTLVECRQDDAREIVVLDVEVQLPRKKEVEVQRIERVAVVFDREDSALPAFLALRPDFPHVAHQNLTSERPRSLCLFDEDYADLKPRWTPAFVVERLREWLRLTAKGALHGDDQPLEPFLQGAREVVILPSRVFEGAAQSGERMRLVVVNEDPFVLVAEPERALRETANGLRAPGVVATAIRCPPRQHGVLHAAPKTLADLDGLVSDHGFSLIGELRKRLRNWKLEPKDVKRPEVGETRLLLVLWLPKTRTSDGKVEATDVRGFLSKDLIADVGRDVGAWEMVDGAAGTVIGDEPANEGTGAETELGVVRVFFTLTREQASELNGADAPAAVAVTAVGVGALGSQVVSNVMRTGFGRWTFIDEDILLPHNVARHVLPGACIGRPKAQMLCSWVNTSLPEEDDAVWIRANVLRPQSEEKARIRECLDQSDLILDMSASVAVARMIAFDSAPSARRASLFLGPSGSELVALTEGADRQIRLDMLDAQFHRALLDQDDLRACFRGEGKRMRYGQSCRDVTVQLPQDLVALHSAIAARFVLELPANNSPRICVWRVHDDMSVERLDISVSPTLSASISEWTVVVDRSTTDRLQHLRRERLGNETGGVLMGRLDLEHRVIYVLEALPSPADSRESRSSYLRGTRGLPAAIRRIEQDSDGVIHYLGEWHSHPEKCSTEPSASDRELLSWLVDRLGSCGLPAVMAIAGDDDLRVVVDHPDEQVSMPWMA